MGGTVQVAEANGLSFYIVLLRASLDVELKSWSSQIRDCSVHSRSLSSLVTCHVLAEGPASKGLSVSFLAKSQTAFTE